MSAGSLLDLNGITIDLRRSAATSRTSNDDKPAVAPLEPAALEAGSVLRERYVIERRLGHGGKGTVFKALDRYRSSLPDLQQYVAIKVLHHRPGREAPDPLGIELQCVQLLSHPNIAKVFDLDRDQGLDFITMELLQGESLASLLARFRCVPMPRPHAWSIVRQIAEGLQHAHHRGIVHADLKPQHIWITPAGEVRILDFGERSARPVASVSLAYACCELLDGRTPDPRDDLYALACITFELLTGAHPFQNRRATEARDFGVVALRPRSLTGGQWRTLSRGLCWHRAGRSIQVGDWLRKVQPVFREPPPFVDMKTLKPVAHPPPKAPYFRTSLALTLLMVTAALWLLFVRVAPGGRVIGEALKSNTASAAVSSARPAAHKPFLTPKAAEYSPATADINATSKAAAEVQVLPGQHFAEIRLHRPPSLSGNVPFVWWTEAATAKPGVDYVDQSKVAQLLPAGKDSVSVFVKLLPHSSSDPAGLFYIAVANKASKGSEHIRHSAVRLMASTS